MAKVYFMLVLVIQASLVFANNDSEEKIPTLEENIPAPVENIPAPEENMPVLEENEETGREILKNKPEIDIDANSDKDQNNWMDMIFMPMPSGVFPTSSAALMTSVTSSNKTAEEQIEDIKEMANKIFQCIQSEMANLLSFALMNCDKETEEEHSENSVRRKRETPMDSSQLIMRLLKHIKNNNDYQNIAIEKMMTAQEIADKFGIDFTPDTDVLSDLAMAANDQAKDMTSILIDAVNVKHANKTAPKEEVHFVPTEKHETLPTEDNTYYVYSVQQPEQELFNQQPFPAYEYTPEHHAHSPAVNYGHHEHHHHEQQMPHYTPPPVTPRPNFYDSVMPYSADYYPNTCPVEPITTTTTILLPVEEYVEPEPELIGEEYEETISSKLYVTRDEEPGSATVNHVMTYTIGEKAHFKKPEIEKLPQQLQYTFFLM